MNHSISPFLDTNQPFPDNEAFTYQQLISAYQGILMASFQAVGFIDGGFCPEPCEHTTLQNDNPELYNRFMNIWQVYKQALELNETIDEYYGKILPHITNPDLDDDPF